MSPAYIISCIILYFLFLSLISWYTGKNDSNESFFLGNRSSPWYVVAFGMIGTLVGLVILLNNMADPAALGAGMSIALITTLYGVLFQNLLFKPAARKIEQNNGIYKTWIACYYKQIII